MRGYRGVVKIRKGWDGEKNFFKKSEKLIREE
jgi:hypothetical protein